MRYVFLPLLCLLACGDSGTQQDAGSERDGGMLVDGAADSVSDAADGNSGDGGPRSGVFVAIDGDDANPGTFDRPLATFEAARDRLRARDEVDDATVYIRGGVYERQPSLRLTAEDSGTAERPVRYLAYPGETVVVSGGVDAAFSDLQVPSADVLELVPVASRDRVRALDLADLGVSIEDFGSIRYWQFGGYGYDNAPGALVFEGERLEYARYPKHDEGPDGDGFIRTGRVLHPGWDLRNGGNDEDDPVGATFEYADDFVSTWSTTWAARGNLWMYGYWQVPYGDGTLQVESLDTAAGTVATVQSSWYAVGEDKRYYFFNAIDALEQPGEYVVDEPAERIYLIPPAGFSTDSQLQTAVLDAPLVHLDGAEHVVFDGLDFKLGRQDAVRVEDASFVRIANFEIRDIEGVGVRMPGEGSYGNVIENGLMMEALAKRASSSAAETLSLRRRASRALRTSDVNVSESSRAVARSSRAWATSFGTAPSARASRAPLASAAKGWSSNTYLHRPWLDGQRRRRRLLGTKPHRRWQRSPLQLLRSHRERPRRYRRSGSLHR